MTKLDKHLNYIDSHKLMYHPERITAWLDGSNIYPLYVEIGPANRCNYRCSFCALDYTGYNGKFVDTGRLRKALCEMADCGVKSSMFAGAGEPLLHPDICDLVAYARKVGIDVSITTNGSLLTAQMSQKLLQHLAWLRISLNAGSPENYAKIHGCTGDNFEIVLQNLSDAVSLKNEYHLPLTIGVQCLILGENVAEIPDLASRLKKTGVDYFSLKPYSRHPNCINTKLEDPHPMIDKTWFADINSHSTENFEVIVRNKAINSINANSKSYPHCLGLPFFACIEADGNIYPCHTFINNIEYSYGNIIDMSFKEVWGSSRKLKVMQKLASENNDKCRLSCRLDQINLYLWQLKNPPAHVNFI